MKCLFAKSLKTDNNMQNVESGSWKGSQSLQFTSTTVQGVKIMWTVTTTTVRPSRQNWIVVGRLKAVVVLPLQKNRGTNKTEKQQQQWTDRLKTNRTKTTAKTKPDKAKNLGPYWSIQHHTALPKGDVPSTPIHDGGQFSDQEETEDEDHSLGPTEQQDRLPELDSEFPSLAVAATVPYEGSDDEEHTSLILPAAHHRIIWIFYVYNIYLTIF
jgi:hypothetical protein